MMPQFAEPKTYRFHWENLAVGLGIFSIGLFKKVVIADALERPRRPRCSTPRRRATSLYCADAWAGVLSYTFQIYFDFSGYSDMAIALARMFGIILPLNFNSPYKAVNIIEFWRRWHMTLSRFLRGLPLHPAGGNRHGKSRRYVNLILTMVIGGLWHGAAWTFVLWGLFHGLCLGVNHLWQEFWASGRQALAVAALADPLGGEGAHVLSRGARVGAVPGRGLESRRPHAGGDVRLGSRAGRRHPGLAQGQGLDLARRACWRSSGSCRMPRSWCGISSPIRR